MSKYPSLPLEAEDATKDEWKAVLDALRELRDGKTTSLRWVMHAIGDLEEACYAQGVKTSQPKQSKEPLFDWRRIHGGFMEQSRDKVVWYRIQDVGNMPDCDPFKVNL